MQAEAEFGCEETNVCGWMFAAEIHPNKKKYRFASIPLGVEQDLTIRSLICYPSGGSEINSCYESK
jgi:hypothetical protein